VQPLRAVDVLEGDRNSGEGPGVAARAALIGPPRLPEGEFPGLLRPDEGVQVAIERPDAVEEEPGELD